MPAKSSKRPLTSIFRAIRDVTLALLVTVLLCEALVRLAGLDPGEEMVMVDVQPELVAGDAFWPMPARYDPNGTGERDEGLAALPRGATQVVLLGDSVLFGVHLSPEQRIAARLSEDFRVTDLAAPGYSTVQMRIAWERHLAKRKASGQRPPEAAVLSLFHNDSAHWALAGDGVRRGCLRFRVPLAGLGHARLDPAAAWWIYRHSAVFRATCRPWIFTDRPCQQTAERRMVAEAARILTTARQQHIQMVVLLLADTNKSWADARAMRQNLHYYDVIADEARRRGALVVEALPLLAKHPLDAVALDTTGHLKPLGHQALADALRGVLSGK